MKEVEEEKMQSADQLSLIKELMKRTKWVVEERNPPVGRAHGDNELRSDGRVSMTTAVGANGQITQILSHGKLNRTYYKNLMFALYNNAC